MAVDPLNVTRLRKLAQSARDEAERARQSDVKKQYDDIARHYDQLIETLVAAGTKKHQPPT